MKAPRLSELTEEKPRKAAKAAPAERPEYPHMSVYLPKAVIKELKRRALDSDLRVHDLLVEGVELMLKAHAWPSIAEIEGRAAGQRG